MIKSIFKISPIMFDMEKSQTKNIQSESEKNIETNIKSELPSPSKKSALYKALSYAYSFYKDKDPENTLSEIPKDTNKVSPISTIRPALLQSIWVEFDSSDSETDEPISMYNSNSNYMAEYNYGYTKYDSSTDEAESVDDGYHSDGSSNTYDSDYMYDNDSNTHINDSETWRNLKH